MNIIIEENITEYGIQIQENLNDISLTIQETLVNYVVEIADMGVQGENGLSAYQIAVKNGFIGTETDFSNSLKRLKIVDLPELP